MFFCQTPYGFWSGLTWVKLVEYGNIKTAMRLTTHDEPYNAFTMYIKIILALVEPLNHKDARGLITISLVCVAS